MEKKQIGIIGAGAIAEHHLKVLSSFADVEIACIANRNEERRTQRATQFGIQKSYERYKDMLAAEKLDALFILVSADAIFETTKACLAAGIPLFIEKPAGLSAAETKELARLAESAGVPVMVGYNRRFFSIIEKALQAVRARGPLLGVVLEAPENIEKVKSLNKFSPLVLERWFIANGTHGIDLLRYLGGEAVEVQATHAAHTEKNGDNFGATMRFSGGAIGQYSSHWNSPGRWQLTLYGEGIRVRLEPLEQGTILIGEDSTSLALDPVDVEFKPGFYKQDRYFIDRLQDKGAIAHPACSIQDAVKTMELAELIAGE